MDPRELDLVRQGERLREALRGVPGLELRSAHRAWLACGAQRARVRIESVDHVRVELPLERAPARRPALEAAAGWPGNLRCAASAQGTSLVVDLRLEDRGPLALELGQVREAIAAIAAGEEPSPCATPPDAQAVEAALTAMNEHEGFLVRTPDGWELRPRLAGVEHRVRLALEPGGVRLRAQLGLAIARDARGEVLADVALRANARLRHARLASSEGALVAEARLSRALVAPERLGWLARAVAAARSHARARLELASMHPAVAECYAGAFLSPDSSGTDPFHPGGEA